ncbi:MAG: hypothetical protein EBS49_01570 [Verrucomicrobia bacterium]|nr:hypothetical protein [Verrucomicrobiota bacterium]
METLVKIFAAMVVLGVLTIWIAYGILAWLRESAPWLLAEPGWRCAVSPPERKTRLVPKGTAQKQAATAKGKKKGNEFSHLPRFARRPPLTGSARPERNWIS